MKSKEYTVEAILGMMAIASVCIILAYIMGYSRGVDHVCNSPQVPFRTVQLPVCATDNATSE